MISLKNQRNLILSIVLLFIGLRYWMYVTHYHFTHTWTPLISIFCCLLLVARLIYNSISTQENKKIALIVSSVGLGMFLIGCLYIQLTGVAHTITVDRYKNLDLPIINHFQSPNYSATMTIGNTACFGLLYTTYGESLEINLGQTSYEEDKRLIFYQVPKAVKNRNTLVVWKKRKLLLDWDQHIAYPLISIQK